MREPIEAVQILQRMHIPRHFGLIRLNLCTPAAVEYRGTRMGTWQAGVDQRKHVHLCLVGRARQVSSFACCLIVARILPGKRR
jgi:hypothetical protein